MLRVNGQHKTCPFTDCVKPEFLHTYLLYAT